MEARRELISRTKKPVEQNKAGDWVAAPTSAELAADIRAIIEAARLRVAQTVNAELVLLYWQIGSHIHRDILGETRAQYGEDDCPYTVETIKRRLRRQL